MEYFGEDLIKNIIKKEKLFLMANTEMDINIVEKNIMIKGN